MVHVSPKAFDLLCLLIEARPNVLTKTDLHLRLWPDVFVSDGNLAMLVTELRAALGETAKEPQFIRTVHRHGYAFNGDVIVHALTHTPGSTPPGAWLALGTTRWPLVPGDNVVGRDPASRIWIDAPSISRRHALVRVDGDVITVDDLQSKNGTTVQGQRVTDATQAKPGDSIRFGSIDTVLHVWTHATTQTEGDL